MNWLRNIWNAQRNAAEANLLPELRRDHRSNLEAIDRLSTTLEKQVSERHAYATLTTTLAVEYMQAIGNPSERDQIPDSIKEAHMLRGVATGWRLADDVRIGKPMWEKRQRMEAKQAEMDQRAMARGACIIPVKKEGAMVPVLSGEQLLDEAFYDQSESLGDWP